MRVPFTAEVCARAIIAACASYGDDPVKAMTTRCCALRRGLAPAGAAVFLATGVKKKQVNRAFCLGCTSIVFAERTASASFLKAKAAALAAIGGAAATMAPEVVATRRSLRPEPSTVSGLPDALLSPRPIAPPIAVEVVQSKTLQRPAAAHLSDRDAKICRLIDEGRSTSFIATALNLSISVVAGVRSRHRPGSSPYTAKHGPRPGAPLKTPRGAASKVAKPVAPDPGLVAGRAEPAPRFDRLAPTRDDRVPQPTRDKIAAADRQLIAEALAKGKVTPLPTAVSEGGAVRGLAVPDHPAPIGFDPTTRKYSRGPNATATGWFNT